MYMLKMGELDIHEADKLDEIGDFKNIKRLIRHVQGAFPVDILKMVAQEERLFKNVHHLTSSAQFLQAVRARDLDKARQIVQLNPWAVRASEAND